MDVERVHCLVNPAINICMLLENWYNVSKFDYSLAPD